MEDTPGASRLPCAKEEIEVLRSLFESMKVNTVEPHRMKQDILSCLPQRNIFHLPGHGYTNQKDPSQQATYA